MGFLSWADRDVVEAQGRRIRQLEVVVQELCRRQGLDPEPLLDEATGVTQQVRDLAAAGRHIEAIKVLRQQSGVGLAEAKAVVDRL